VRRLALLVAAGALWLFLAALPALADGGPHVSTVNNGSLGINADGCAGCHRAHTAQGPFLINAADEEDLCLTCHGAASTGSTVDVMTGVQYVAAGNGTRTGTQLGAARNGGFDQARIGASEVYRLSIGTSLRTKVPSSSPENVNSAHLALPENGLTMPGIAWGNGANGSGDGPAAVDLSCGSCHNPHGNGQYRILNTIPATTGVNAAWVKTLAEVGNDGVIPDIGADAYRTTESHGLLVGDIVTVAGNSSGAANVANATVATIIGTNGFTLTGVTPGSGTGGTVTRNGGVGVTDAALPPPGDTRNYTIIQTVATAPTLLASQAAAYPSTAGNYFHRTVPWNATTGTNMDAPNGLPLTFNDQMNAWCSSCHTRYLANQNPIASATDTDGVDNSWRTPRQGDTDFMYQHRVRSDRACTTCHVSHGSNAVMTGTFSSTFTYPDGTVSASSRLLKVDNRGTCQSCHDPTGTFPANTSVGTAPVPLVP